MKNSLAIPRFWNPRLRLEDFALRSTSAQRHRLTDLAAIAAGAVNYNACSRRNKGRRMPAPFNSG